MGGICAVTFRDSGKLLFPSDSRKPNGDAVLVVKDSDGMPFSEISSTASVTNELPTGRKRSPRRLIFSLEVLLMDVRTLGEPSLNKLGRGLRLP